MELTGASWRKSSYSSNGGNTCVEVAADLPGGVVGLRDSKDRQGPVLIVTGDQWTAFTAGVRRGEFNPG